MTWFVWACYCVAVLCLGMAIGKRFRESKAMSQRYQDLLDASDRDGANARESRKGGHARDN